MSLRRKAGCIVRDREHEEPIMVYVLMADCHCRKCESVQATCLGVYTTYEAAKGMAGAAYGTDIKIEEHMLEVD